MNIGFIFVIVCIPLVLTMLLNNPINVVQAQSKRNPNIEDTVQTNPSSSSLIISDENSRTNVNIIKDINFNAAGDYGCNEYTDSIINNMIKTNPDLVLGTGDYGLTPSAYICWSELISPLTNKMKIAFGNHDFADQYILSNLERQFNLKPQSYSFNFNHIHFISLSTETEFEQDSTQYEFIERDLQQISSNPDIKWIVVFMHKPLYTTADFDKGDAKNLRKTYMKLFTEYGVDLVLHGHVQFYQRTYPILYNEENPKTPLIINNGSSFYSSSDGTMFVDVGTGGDKLHEDLNYPPFLAIQKKSFGFLNVEMKNNGTTLVGKFISDSNEVIDRFVINNY